MADLKILADYLLWLGENFLWLGEFFLKSEDEVYVRKLLRKKKPTVLLKKALERLLCGTSVLKKCFLCHKIAQRKDNVLVVFKMTLPF